MNSRRFVEPQAPIRQRTYCDRCRRWFIDDRALEQHTRASARHNVCSGCDFDYITLDEMEECDCNGSEEDDEADLDMYSSAGTLSDDGGGSRNVAQYGSVLADFNTYYSIPGAWNRGTRTSESGSSIPSTDPNEYRYEMAEYGLPEDYDTSHSEESYSHSDDATEDDDEIPEEDRGQPPVPDAEPTPYCQRCNREFRTENGLHLHNRMSSIHPWYCATCRLDHDRESDLQRHNSVIHAEGSQPSDRQQSTVDPSSRTVINLLGQINTQLGRMLDRSTTAEADASTSTIRTTDVTPIPQSRPMRVPDPVQPVRAEQGRIEPRTGGEVGGRPQLVVTCPLCLEDAMALTSTLCGHVFCKECITAAINHKPECPVCRAFTHIKSLHSIFLNVIS